MEDLLLYFDTDREPAGITAYNPTTGETLYLPLSIEINGIQTSGDGRIAYIQDNDVWVLDVLNAPDHPINISRTPDEAEVLLNWSPDGNLLQYQAGSGPYLLYIYDGDQVFASDYGFDLFRYWNKDRWYVSSLGSNSDDGSWSIWDEHGWRVFFDAENPDTVNWSVWNEQQHINLDFPTLFADPVWQVFRWTPDNHLFITIGYDEKEYMQPIGKTQIFYWNGDTVKEVMKPSEDETFLLGELSTDGRLIFYTTNNDTYARRFIWDGESFTSDHIPDLSTLEPINSPTDAIGDIEWMPDGRLAIVARGNPDSDTLLGHPYTCDDPCPTGVYIWDSQTLIPVTSTDFGSFLIDVHDNGSIAVTDFDGFYFTGITIFDPNLDAVVQSRGLHSVSSWSADGNLAFCKATDLLVWNGQDTILLARGAYSKWLIAQSQSMVCSVG